MVANILRLCGLYLGPEHQMLATRLGNSDGHWENREFLALNDQVLARLGGDWAKPPPEDHSNFHKLDRERESAERLVSQFAGYTWWGWKDPRNCLTLPFWLDFFPHMKVIICLRHPLEAVRSLERRSDEIVQTNWPRLSSSSAGLRLWRVLDRATSQMRLRPRNFFPTEHWLTLWEIYNSRVIDFTRPEQRLVTHYVSYLTQPRAEIERLLKFLSMPYSEEILTRSSAVISSRLRHQQLTAGEIRQAGVSGKIAALYRRLCEEAFVNT